MTGRRGSRGPTAIADMATAVEAGEDTRNGGAATEAGMPGSFRGRGTEARPLRIYAFGVSRNRLEHAIQTLRAPAVVVRDARDADIVLTLKNYFRQKAQPIRDAEARGMPVYVLRSNTSVQMENLLASLFPPQLPGSEWATEEWPGRNGTAVASQDREGDPLLAAISEAEDAISSVMAGGPPVQLAPQASRIRQVQHQLAERYALSSRSRGREPNRGVEISRGSNG